MGYGSTIRQKKGQCAHPGCGYSGALIGSKCPTHYWNDRRMKSVAKLEEKELIRDESLSAVIEDLDAVFSQYIRLRDCDENGYITCYCGAKVYWTETDNSHYIPRSHMNTRFLEENCAGACQRCNQTLKGNLLVYGAWLEAKRLGSVEALEQQASVLYKYDVPELKGLIAHYSKLVRQMKSKIPLKI